MKGRVLIVGFLVALAGFAGALWYFQTRAFYRDLPPQPLEIAGRTYPILEWRGIDATSSPLETQGLYPAGPGYH